MKHKNNGLIPDDVFMSARLQIAAMAMQAMLSIRSRRPDWLAKCALEYADALIEAEKEQK